MIYPNQINNMCPQQPGSHENEAEQNRDDSGASVDEERQADICSSQKLNGYDVFLATKVKIAKAMEGPEKMLVGDCDSKTELVKRLSGGSFGEVYLGKMVRSGHEVAVKIEPQSFGNQFLLHEGNVYRQLEGGPGISKVHWFGLHGHDYAIMTMDLLGPTLYDLFTGCGDRLSLKTVLMLADQMVDIMEHVHNNNFVHRDISPNNFMIGTGDQSHKLFLIDFGHAKKVSRSPVYMPSTRHRFHQKKPQLVGTPRFVSVFAHMAQEAALRDDMESLGYVWLYLLQGRLQWQGIRTNTTEEKMRKIADLKIKTPVEDICKDVPEEFAIYLEHIRSLGQYDKPDYANIRQMFKDLAAKHEFELDDVYDWTVPAGQQTLATPTTEVPSICVSADPISH